MWCLLTEEGQQFVGVISMLACFSDYGPYWCSLHLFFPYSAVRRITSCCEFATKVVVKFLQSWCEQLKFVFRHSSVSYLKLTHLKPLKKPESDAQHFLPTSVWCRKMKKYCAFRAKCGGGGKKRVCDFCSHTLYKMTLILCELEIPNEVQILRCYLHPGFLRCKSFMARCLFHCL